MSEEIRRLTETLTTLQNTKRELINCIAIAKGEIMSLEYDIMDAEKLLDNVLTNINEIEDALFDALYKRT